MKRQTKQVAWIVVLFVLAIAGFFGIQTYSQFAKMESGARDACRVYLEGETGEEIDIAFLETSGIEVVFPKPFDKRFRTTCTYGEVSVELECKPLKPWFVVATDGLK